jgi:hypothetical protein
MSDILTNIGDINDRIAAARSSRAGPASGCILWSCRRRSWFRNASRIRRRRSNA